MRPRFRRRLLAAVPSRRLAKGDTKRKLPFNNPAARPKTTLFGKRTQFAAYLRLDPERVNAPRSYNREPLKRAAQREKRRRSSVISRRTFGCLSNHGKKFCLFQNFFRERVNSDSPDPLPHTRARRASGAPKPVRKFRAAARPPSGASAPGSGSGFGCGARASAFC